MPTAMRLGLTQQRVQISEQEFVNGYQHFQAVLAAAGEEADTDASAPDEQAGHVPSGGDTSNEGRLVLTSTEDAAKHVDFNDLVTAGCAIPDTVRPGISLDQLERIMVHVPRR